VFALACLPAKPKELLERSNTPRSSSELWAALHGWEVLPHDFEPYVIIKTPPAGSKLFDERFANYGKNKV
jgi:hypothetical protein